MEVTLGRATRIRTLPKNAVLERKIFKAKRNSFTPANDNSTTWFSLLVKFPSPLFFSDQKY